MSEYTEQAEKFLKETDTTFKSEFVKNGKHFDDDKEDRDIYEITLTRGNRVFKFPFGQSIARSGRFIIYCPKRHLGNYIPKGLRKYGDYDDNKNFEEPTAYDVLTCLTKSDPETFEDFCTEYGYESDSRKAENLYFKIRDEFKEVRMLWTDEQIEKLQEIQ